LKPFVTTQIDKWDICLTTSITNGPASSSNPFVTPLATEHHGTESYAAKLDSQYPGYICRVFRYAQKVKISLATFSELAQASNEKSITIINHPTITLSRRQLNNWFTCQGGSEFSPTTKPLDTPQHIEKRNVWVRKYYDILTNVEAPVVYLDEMWFYTTNRRRKIKRLTRGEEEDEGDDFIP